MQELAPPEPKKEDPFEGMEAETAELATGVKQEPEEDAQVGQAASEDAEMADAAPEEAVESAEVEELPEEEAVHMPASQDDPGLCPSKRPQSFCACKPRAHMCVPAPWGGVIRA